MWQLYHRPMNAPDAGTEAGIAGELAAAGSAGGVCPPDWPAILSAHEHWLRRVVTTRLKERHAVDDVCRSWPSLFWHSDRRFWTPAVSWGGSIVWQCARP